MTVPELVAYVRQQSQAGISAQELREMLMSAGWSERDVENALHDVAAGLRPVTSGASIHEDLAQVRGLVAHLTARVGRLETRLTNTGPAMLTEPEELPSGAMERDRALPAPRTRWGIVVGMLIVLIVCVNAGSYLAAVTPENAPRALTITTGIVVLLALFSWFFVRHRSAWPARFMAVMVVALGAWSTWLAWNSYQLLEWTTTLAIAVLLVVYLGVIARWIRRIERR